MGKLYELKGFALLLVLILSTQVYAELSTPLPLGANKALFWRSALWHSVPQRGEQSAIATEGKGVRGRGCVQNRYPLIRKPYMELPLGSIKAQGWLQEMLLRQRSGATSRMDELYPVVMGERNGWLGGDGDQWERGPYWIDGLLPLAYLLDDKALQQKVQRWVEWALASQREDGYFGPTKDYGPEPDVQRDNAADWWPRMVVLKILQQYYSATGDERVIGFMQKYFQYQLKTLPAFPLGHWTHWATYREGDNLQAVYWLYNRTGDDFLLQLADLLHSQGVDFTHLFTETDAMRRFWSIHCVNLAQGLKEPIIYYQQHPEQKYLDAVKQGLADLRRYNGQPQGMYGGDEGLHGDVPTQGSELCSAVELMFSLEKMVEITGDLSFADHLERVAYNALPTQITDDFMYKQYFQQANQVIATRAKHNFYEENSHGGTDIVFGTLSGYPCCWSNMHQAWPKLVQSLWFATPDEGLAALVYAPSEVTTSVAGGHKVKLTESTCYPMDDKLSFTIHFLDKADKKAGLRFPLYLRVPGWCQEATACVGEEVTTARAEEMVKLDRMWKDGDVLTLSLPMTISLSRWCAGAVAVERGPLVYGLKMNEKWTRVDVPESEQSRYGKEYYEVTSPDRWNYGLVQYSPEDFAQKAQVTIHPERQHAPFFWNLENAPIEITVDAKEIPGWELYCNMAGPLPYSTHHARTPVERITLIPYGCTTLRISEFPLVYK